MKVFCTQGVGGNLDSSHSKYNIVSVLVISDNFKSARLVVYELVLVKDIETKLTISVQIAYLKSRKVS